MWYCIYIRGPYFELKSRALVSNLFSNSFSFDFEPFPPATKPLCLFPSCNHKTATAATYTLLPSTAVLLRKETESPTAVLLHEQRSTAIVLFREYSSSLLLNLNLSASFYFM